MNDTPTGARALPQPIDAALVPRFAGIPTFMRLPVVTSPTEVDVALVGVPFDGGTTNRAGARHGPREMRNQSSLMRRVHHVSNVAPYDLVRVGTPVDIDCPVSEVRGGIPSMAFGWPAQPPLPQMILPRGVLFGKRKVIVMHSDSGPLSKPVQTAVIGSLTGTVSDFGRNQATIRLIRVP